MTDLKPSANPLYLSEEELRRGIELLYFAYRDFSSESDDALAKNRYGRAHHRVIHFVERNPGIIVSDLLKVLQITKQSLSRVLGRLIEDGLIAQSKGANDKRRRHLRLTGRGIDLADELMRIQRTRLRRAYRDAGAEAVAGFRAVLAGLVDDNDRAAILKTL